MWYPGLDFEIEKEHQVKLGKSESSINFQLFQSFSYVRLCDPMDCSMPGCPVLHQPLELAQTHVHWISDPYNHLILHRPLLLLPSVFPSIRVFASESAFHIRWPKYWNFSFSNSPFNKHAGLISFRIDLFDLLAIQGTLKSHLQHHSSKASILQCSAFFMVQLSHPYFYFSLFFWALKSLQMVIAAMKLKDTYSLEGKLWPT